MIHNHYCVKAPESYQGRDGLMEQGPKYMEIQRGDCPVLCTTVHLEAFPVSKVMAERLTSYTELLSISKGWGDKKKKKKGNSGPAKEKSSRKHHVFGWGPQKNTTCEQGWKEKAQPCQAWRCAVPPSFWRTCRREDCDWQPQLPPFGSITMFMQRPHFPIPAQSRILLKDKCFCLGTLHWPRRGVLRSVLQSGALPSNSFLSSLLSQRSGLSHGLKFSPVLSCFLLYPF